MDDIRRWPISQVAAEGAAHSPVRRGRLRSHWVDVDGTTMHTRVSCTKVPESAPDVVLVHGIVVSSLYMVPTARRLARHCRVYAPDLPGFGLSDNPPNPLDIVGMADALAAWMQRIGLRRAVLVGNSMGCQTAVTFAVRYPQLVDRVVLQGPTVDPEGRTALRQIGRWLRNAPREPLSEWLILIRDWFKFGLRRFITTLRHMLREPIEEKLPHVRVPTMVVRGTRDPIAPERWVREMVRLLPDGRLRQIPGATHTLNYSMPLEFVRVMAPFLFASEPNPRRVET